MDNHPIPQDVTGFQFKLVGSMTVKQFAQLAGPCIIAVILYYSPFFILIKIIGIPFFVLFGLCLAFVPIEGRPIDVMASHFLRALFAPNQFVFHKIGRQLAFTTVDLRRTAKEKVSVHIDPLKKKQLQAFLQNVQSRPQSPSDSKEDEFLKSLDSIQFQGPVLLPASSPMQQRGEAASPISTNPLPPQPQMPPTKNIAQTQNQASLNQQTAAPMDNVKPDIPLPQMVKPSTAAQSINSSLPYVPQPNSLPQKNIDSTPNPKESLGQEEQPEYKETEQLSQKLDDIAHEKQKLEDELRALKSQLAGRQTVSVPIAKPVDRQVEQPAQEEDSPHVLKVPKSLTTSIGAPAMPDSPNLIAGVVKDPRGNVLQNILVEVKDKEGSPVRAFKTNALGQFSSATPLINGDYTIEFEDPKDQHKFDTIELRASGEIMLPIEVISRDAREELRRALFT